MANVKPRTAAGSNEIVERVAKAICMKGPIPVWCDGCGSVGSFADCKGLGTISRDEARAAIAAMRELPESTYEAFAWHFDNAVTWGSGTKVQWLWRDLIDAALIGGPPDTED